MLYFSSPEHKVLKVSYCDIAVSVVRLCSRGHIFGIIIMKLGQFVVMKSRMSLKMGHVQLKTRSIVQICGKLCVHSRGHIFSLIIVKPGQNLCLDKISNKCENESCQVKN